MGRSASSVSIIGGADGPTSVFTAGKGKKSIRQRLQSYFYRKKKDRVKKAIAAGSHTLDETIAYIKEKYHAAELPHESHNFIEQQNCLKESLILEIWPGLLGDLAAIEPPETDDKNAIAEYLGQCRLRSERVRSIEEEDFPLDFHLYEIPFSGGGKIEVMAESRWAQFGVSYSVYSKDKGLKKQIRKIYQDIYLYYGVGKEDIRNQSKRYSSLVAALCM